MANLSINDITGLPLENAKPVQSHKGSGFGEAIKNAVQRVDHLERESNQSAIDLLQGKADVSETMIALQKSDLSMRMLLTVRNKVLDAYREIMRMQF